MSWTLTDVESERQAIEQGRAYEYGYYHSGVYDSLDSAFKMWVKDEGLDHWEAQVYWHSYQEGWYEEDDDV